MMYVILYILRNELRENEKIEQTAQEILDARSLYLENCCKGR